jgi:IS30 family transposase
MTNYTHLIIHEREQISNLMAAGKSMRQIATILGRDVSTISRELKRNLTTPREIVSDYKDINKTKLVTRANPFYSPSDAQKMSENRRKHKKHKISGKIRLFVIKKIRAGWSPELIAGRLKREYDFDIHHETIYRFIYSEKNEHLKLREYLPKFHKKRRKKTGRRYKHSNIPFRTSIHDRSKNINDRSEFGHFEGDSVIGKSGTKESLHTERERKSRMIFASKIPDKTAASTIEAMNELFSKMPANARKSVTLDNGSEFSKHHELHDLGMDTFFADPYSSYQRGTNENGNGLLRKFFPKGFDFSKITDAELQEAVYYWNNRPMKCLDYKTPQEVWDDEVNKLEKLG